MEVTRDIALFDLVELVQPVDDAPAGARGGVVEMHDPETAVIEITAPELDVPSRIVFAPLAKLRRLPSGS